MKVRWVRQEHANGCSLAVLAMLTKDTYANVLATVDSWKGEPHDWEKDGTTFYTLDRYLVTKGYWSQKRFDGWFEGEDWTVPFAPQHYVSVRQPSGNTHFVYMDAGGVVADPLREGPFDLSEWAGNVNHIVGVTATPYDPRKTA